MVTSRNDNPRLYSLINEKGNEIKRNRVHLIPTNEELKLKIEDDCANENIGANENNGANNDDSEEITLPKVQNNDGNAVVDGQRGSSVSSGSVRKTRSGRVVVPPKYLDAYVKN